MKKANRNLILILIPLCLAFIFFYPRMLIATLGPENPWTSYFYQYGLGNGPSFL